MELIQIISLIGAALQLIPFTLQQLGKLNSDTSYTYQIGNVMGSVIMLTVAAYENQIGFVIMEGTWFVASTIGLYNLVKANRARKCPAVNKHTNIDYSKINF